MLPGPKSDLNAASRLEDQGRTRALLYPPTDTEIWIVSDLHSRLFATNGDSLYDTGYLSRRANKLTGAMLLTSYAGCCVI